jgi:hypothetical protein
MALPTELFPSLVGLSLSADLVLAPDPPIDIFFMASLVSADLGMALRERDCRCWAIWEAVESCGSPRVADGGASRSRGEAAGVTESSERAFLVAVDGTTVRWLAARGEEGVDEGEVEEVEEVDLFARLEPPFDFGCFCWSAARRVGSAALGGLGTRAGEGVSSSLKGCAVGEGGEMAMRGVTGLSGTVTAGAGGSVFLRQPKR